MCQKCGCSTVYGSPKITRGIDCEVADIVEEVYGKGLGNASEGQVQVVDSNGNPIWSNAPCCWWEFYDYSLTGGDVIQFSGKVTVVGELRLSLPPALGNINGYALVSISLSDNTSPQDSRWIAWNTNVYPVATGTPKALEVDLPIDGKLQLAHLTLPAINSDILFRVDGLDGTDPLDVDYVVKVYMLRS